MIELIILLLIAFQWIVIFYIKNIEKRLKIQDKMIDNLYETQYLHIKVDHTPSKR